MIRPFLGKMTKSELHAVMTGGFATIAGTVLGAYIGFGVGIRFWCSSSSSSSSAFDVMIALTRSSLPSVSHYWMSGTNPLLTPRAWF